MSTKQQILYVVLPRLGGLALALILVACGGQPAAQTPTEPPAATEAVTVAPAATEPPTAAPTEPPTQALTEAPAATATEALAAPEGALVSVKVDQAPTLDGAADEAAWQDAPEIVIPVSGGANNGSTEVSLKSVYTGDMVYFLATWADPSESWLRVPWEKQADGTWIKLADPNDKGGDNNLYYEDKLAFLWDIGNSIPNFNTAGCFTACHAGENSDVKPYGNMYTAEEGQLGDIWHWKTVRNLNQADDQYLDWTRYTADTPGAGRKTDASDSGGYANNETEDQKMPAFMPPDGGNKDGSPGYILDSEKVPFDDSLFQPGDMVPGIIKSEFVGDRGDVSAGWQYADGKWTVEFGRALDTGSETDVQFTDLAATYYFGVAAFDNASVRHAFQTGATPFVFTP
jgi:hypothetical protein